MSNSNVTFGKRNPHLAKPSTYGVAPPNARTNSIKIIKTAPNLSYQSLLSGSDPDTVAEFSSTRATEAEMSRFFGRSWGAYQNMWKDMQNSASHKISFSTAAFLGSFSWLLYRKQYVPAIGVIALEFGLPLAFPDFATYILFALAVVVGLCGKSIVVQNAMTKIVEIKAKRLSPEATALKIQNTGGTSWVASLLVTVVIGAITISHQVNDLTSMVNHPEQLPQELRELL